mgnify:CR=1 FL=1
MDLGEHTQINIIIFTLQDLNRMKNKICPYCKGNKIEEKYHAGPGILKSQSSLLNKSYSSIIYEVCMSCGSIIHSRVKDISKIK